MNQDKAAKENSRLYIGNLDPTIDEYALVKLFEPFGKITLLDFLFHFSGPKRGQPRGYCFIEYSTKQEALKAMDAMSHKMIKGRPLSVSFALTPAHEDSASRKGHPSSSLHRPNLLSVMKSQKMAKSSTDAKIKAIEKKLAALQGSKNSEEPSNDNSSTAGTKGNKSEALSSLPKTSHAKKRYQPY